MAGYHCVGDRIFSQDCIFANVYTIICAAVIVLSVVEGGQSAPILANVKCGCVASFPIYSNGQFLPGSQRACGRMSHLKNLWRQVVWRRGVGQLSVRKLMRERQVPGAALSDGQRERHEVRARRIERA